MGILGISIGGLLILWGLYGVLKKQMIAPWAVRASGRGIMEASRNIPFSQTGRLKNYLIYGTYAVVYGVIVILIGIVVIFASL